MGTWDTGLYQNDLSADVRDDYISKLKAGKSDEDALQEILSEYKEESEDDDEKYDFYLGLADTLWKKGRLADKLKAKALEILEEDKISDRWEGEKIRKERIKVLDKLKEKLVSPMPERKKVPVLKPYYLGWEEGQVYYFKIEGPLNLVNYERLEKYVGSYILVYIDKIYTEDWFVKEVPDEVADVYFLFRNSKPEKIEDVLNSSYVKIYDKYIATLFEVSKRERPQNLTLLGKCDSFVYPKCDDKRKDCFFWSKEIGVRDVLLGYEEHVKFEQENN